MAATAMEVASDLETAGGARKVRAAQMEAVASTARMGRLAVGARAVANLEGAVGSLEGDGCM